MMSNETRNKMRQIFFDAWQKYKNDDALTPLEKQVVIIIQAHPEYNKLLNNPSHTIDQDYSTDNNPFLHMGLHLSLLEQIHTNRPPGIHDIYQQLAAKLDNAHRAEHLMMEIMANLLWNAQEQGVLPDEQNYLDQLRLLI